MESRTQERVERWDSRPFTGGYDELGTLADDGFSGAVAAGGAWLFMLNGRIVGIVDGDVDDFADASGTLYDAPHPSLPLLCSMQERGGETRAKYYTNETPLSDVDETLTDGSFTGYVELSEKVLSGDYYAVYYGGRRMAAAYIGNAERLLTGDEAFERAADEVGIYEVVDVDVDVIDVPGRGSGAEQDATSADSAADATPEGTTGGDEFDAGGDPESVSEGASETSSASGPDSDLAGTDDAATDADDGPDEPIVTEAEPDAEAGDDDPTGERTGITRTDETASDPPSPGITDAPTDESANRRVDRTSATGRSADEPHSQSELERSPASSDEGATAADTTVDDVSSVEDASGTATDSRPATDRSDTGDSTPSPDEVEAAAEDLADDVPWSGGDADGSRRDSSGRAGRGDTEPRTDADANGRAADPAADESANDLEKRFEQEEQWRETTSIPSLDPDHTTTASESGASRPGDASGASSAGDASNRSPGARSDRDSPAGSDTSPRTGSTSSADAGGSRASDAAAGRASDATGGTGAETGDRDRSGTRERPRSERGREAQNPSRSDDQRTAAPDRGSSSVDEALESDMLEREDRIDQLTQRVDELERRRDALRSKYEDIEAERDRLRSENEDLTATVERLQARIDDLEAELEEARAAEPAAGTAETSTQSAGVELSPAQALAGTNLFVRYDSKSQPTLGTARDGEADRSEVAANLRLEHHTQFDETDATVEGRPFEEFLVSTMEYQFVDWLVETLLYEIRDTGRGDGLGDLYDAIPRIDRAELHASVSLADDDTEEVPDEVTFDVVAFDKRGNPLVVATLNDSRDPATQGMLESLEEEASAVAANYPDLGAAFVVTSSFFEPGALEVTERATSGGFLSRSGSLSYVNLSRKQGYHLCLVESRSGGFHVNVPEL